MASATKKISRKDIAKMSFGGFLNAARGPYGRLLAYMRPYRRRFFLGILFGICFAGANGMLVWTIKHAGDLVLPNAAPKAHVMAMGETLDAIARKHNVTKVELEQLNPDPEKLKPGHPVVLPVNTTIPKFLREWAAPTADGRTPGTLVLALCLAIPLVMACRGLFSYLNAYCVLWVSQRVLDDIRQKVYRHTLGQSLEFFNRQKAGDLVQTVFNQTRIAQQALTSIASDIVKQPVSIVSAVAMMLYFDWKFTIAALLLFPLCLLPVLLVSKKVRKSAAKEEDEAGQMMVLMHEAFGGIRVVKTHAREDYEAERFNAANQAMLRFVMKWRKAMELTGPAVETVASFGISGALIYAWWTQMPNGTLLALVGALVLIYPAFKALSRIHLMMQKCLAATTKVFELLDRNPAIQDASNAQPLVEVQGEIRFEEVTFSYPGTEGPAIRGVNLSVPIGSTCAFVGHTGSGKSTLLALLQRLYEPQQGRITINGRDLREITQASLREHIATVSQDVFLFHDSIRQNIRYGRLDAKQEEIEHAAETAHAHQFIVNQPHGYDTVIGDKGCNLSGGQQQRLSIARALLKNAPILLLDEATSALDSESEKRIQAALETLARGRTVFAIAHRLSTILKADQIVVMDHGVVRAVGKHADLYESSPEYRRLYDLQFNHSMDAAA